MPQSNPICIKCSRYNLSRTCDAFTLEIPDVIWLGESNHKEPIEGDNGLQFKPFKEDRG